MENIKRAHLHYPWLSILLALTTIVCLFIIANPNLLITKVQVIPNSVFNTVYQAGTLVFILLIIIWDMGRFYRKRKRHNAALNELFNTKKQLQNKAHTYASHSDKLKLFISDRLLEYIQYDEKFMHFKNIAAEVRHNGVICFDKVQTALTLADKHHAQPENQDALASIRYLWDLLDLSTTDNIALHIGNYLCECEEHYFQSLLHSEKSKRKDKPSPYEVTFFANMVLIDCLKPLVDDPEELMKRPMDATIQYKDSQFILDIESGSEMLGNQNHLRLLFENLINNALFYHKKTYHNKSISTKKPSKPIVIKLRYASDRMILQLYNYGQQISDDKKEKIFQLGYSTRRKKENHGKGLGLYFVNSIAQGYEGKIDFNNINNANDTIAITFHGHRGEKETLSALLVNENHKTMVMNQQSTETQKNIAHEVPFVVNRVELLLEKHQQHYNVDLPKTTKNGFITVANLLSIAEWKFDYKYKRNSTFIIFSPMDITGVMFSASLPTAEARLDYSNSDTLDDELTLDEDNEDYSNILARENEFKNA